MKNILKNADIVILVIVAILCIIGVLGIYSAGYSSASGKDEYIKQIIWIGIGIVSMFIFWITNYKMFEKISTFLYVLSIILLVAVLFTTPINDATSWFDLKFFLFQPSEICKIFYILSLASILNKMNKKEMVNKFKSIVIVAVTFLLPFVLILKQPDFGTAIVFAVITIVMLFKAGISYKYILIGLILFVIAMPLVYNFILSTYQQERIQVFLNPELDPLDSGYNAIQSKIAIGSGMLFGTGLLKGTQTQFGYLPVKSSDFIFSAISEELGFVTSAAIVILYTFMLIRFINISTTSKDEYGSLVAIGIAGMFMFHLIENVGMTMGLLPITGIPLLFVSYGGTSIITSFIALGILLSINSRQKKFIFTT